MEVDNFKQLYGYIYEHFLTLPFGYLLLTEFIFNLQRSFGWIPVRVVATRKIIFRDISF